MPPFILLTNDDGIQSPGLRALFEVLGTLGPVRVVAPDRERSAVGHALTLHKPLRANQVEEGWYAVDGTPTDCVNLGVHGLLKQVPDLVVSGINRGANLADDITYSGTVAAAMEGALMGVPSIAVSLNRLDDPPELLQETARIALELARQALQEGLPPDTFLNLNTPASSARGVRLTVQGRRHYSDQVFPKIDPRGRTYYWLGGSERAFESLPGSDSQALEEGYASVTPLHLDLTNHRSLPLLRSWQQGQFFSETD